MKRPFLALLGVTILVVLVIWMAWPRHIGTFPSAGPGKTLYMDSKGDLKINPK